MAANNLTASFILKLEDKLSGGLNKLQKLLSGLIDLAKKFGFDKLDGVDAKFDKLTGGAGRLKEELSGVTRGADRAAQSLKRMGDTATAASRPGVFSRAGSWVTGGLTAGAGAVRRFGQKIDPISAAGSGISLWEPLHSWSELSNTMRHQAITAHQYGPDADKMMAGLRTLYTNVAIQTAQSSHKIAEAGFWMALTGMSPDLVNKLTPLSAKIATAYNTEVQDAAKTAFGLNYSMGIGEGDMERALGMLALLGKHGHFLFADQAKEMPGIAAAAQQSHMTGMASLEQIGAAMQIAMKVVDPAQPGMAATLLEHFLRQIQQAREENTFGKYSLEGKKVDLGDVLMDAAGKGQSPMEATLALIKKIQDNEAKRLHITDPAKRAQSDTEVLSHLFRDMYAGTFASAMMHNVEEYKHLKEIAHNVTTDMIDKDFREAMRDVNAQTKLFGEELTQISDRAGSGFEPVLHRINWALLQVIHGFKWLDEYMPGAGNAFLVTAGSVLALIAAMGLLGIAAPAVAATMELLGGTLGVLFAPEGLLALAVAGTFLAITGQFDGFVTWVDSWTGGAASAAITRAGGVFDGLADVVRTRVIPNMWLELNGLSDWIDRWSGGALTIAVNKAAAILQQLRDWDAQLDQWALEFENSPFGKVLKRIDEFTNFSPSRLLYQMVHGGGQTEDAPAAPAVIGPGGEVPELHIYTHADPGTRISDAYTVNGTRVSVFRADPGQVLGRQ
jgi:hypothetical protein